jgi:hypothetical protein
MTDNFRDVEQRLINGFHAQLDMYDQALGLVDRAREMNAILDAIGALDNELAEDKAVWRFSERKAGPELSGVMAQLAERIQKLAALVDRRVDELQSSQRALLPEVDQCIQHRRMLHAYGKSR